MKKIFYLGLITSLLATSCSNDDNQYYKKPVVTDGTMELQGGEGGAMAINSVFVDLSGSKQVSIKRESWNLALYCGTEFGVRLNGTTGGRAMEAGGDITVTTIIGDQEHKNYLTQLVPSMGSGDFTTADKIDSDTNLAGTVIKQGKTYILSTGETNTEIYKVAVSEKNSTTYSVRYALWNSSQAKTIEVVKRGGYSFVGVSLNANKMVDVQPQTDAWDIVWGRNTYISAMAVGIPFVISDLVFLNSAAGVQAVEIAVSDNVTYNNYTAEMAAKAKFSSNIDTIGSNWRKGGGPNAAPAVKTDRFYLVKDVQGNIYKLGFVSMNDGEDGGKRGYPEIKYTLITEKK